MNFGKKAVHLIAALLAPTMFIFVQWLTQLIVVLIFSASQLGSSIGLDERALTDAVRQFADENFAYMSVISALITIIIVYTFFRASKPSRFAENCLQPIGSGPRVIRIAAIGLWLNIICRMLIELIPFNETITQAHRDNMEALQAAGPLMLLFATVVAAPIVEEIIFRAVCYSILRRAYGAVTSLILQSLIFAVFHFNSLQLFYVFLTSMVIGFVFRKTKSLYASILLHMSFNASNVVPLYYPDAIAWRLMFLFIFILLLIMPLYSVYYSSKHPL